MTTPARHFPQRPVSGVRRALAVVLLAAAAMLAVPTSASADENTSLYLVTLDGPGLSGLESELESGLPPVLAGLRMGAQQARVLASVGASDPVYTWRTALNGFAVELTDAQARELSGNSEVALVERNEVRPLTSSDSSRRVAVAPDGPERGGAGTVIGVIDSGITPESRLFADVPQLGTQPGRLPRRLRRAARAGTATPATASSWRRSGSCAASARTASGPTPASPRATPTATGPRWRPSRAATPASPCGCPATSLGDFGGMAPQARIAVYKACWGAPDPADDGCATADLVTAIDRATGDGVDVLSLSVGGPHQIDTVERALLGAAEADVVVIAAAGNDGAAAYAAHPSPWVTTVGGTTAPLRKGRVVRGSAEPLTGAMVGTRPVGPARLVLGADRGRPGVIAGGGPGVRARKPRRPSGGGPDRAVRAGSRGPRRQVPCGRSRRRRGHGAGQRHPRVARRGLPQRADRAPDPIGRAGAGELARPAPPGSRVAATRGGRLLDTHRRPLVQPRRRVVHAAEAGRGGPRDRHPGRRTDRQPRGGLGLRHRHLCRHGVHDGGRREPAGAAGTSRPAPCARPWSPPRSRCGAACWQQVPGGSGRRPPRPPDWSTRSRPRTTGPGSMGG